MSIEDVIRSIVKTEVASLKGEVGSLTASVSMMQESVNLRSREDAVTSRLNELEAKLKFEIDQKTKTTEIGALIRRCEINLDKMAGIINSQFVSKAEWNAALDALTVEFKQDIESVMLTDTRAVDHAKVWIQCCDGLKGGGAIDKNVAIAVDIDGLESHVPAPDSKFMFSDKKEGGLFNLTFDSLVSAILRVHHVLERLEGLEKEYARERLAG